MPLEYENSTNSRYYEEQAVLACRDEFCDSSAYLPKAGGTSLFTLVLLGKG